MAEPRWPYGSVILLREVWRGRVWTARPVRVVRDTDDLIVLYLCAGTRWKMAAPQGKSHDLLEAALPGGEWRLEDRTWMWGDTLLLGVLGEAHVIFVMWTRADRSFKGWYVNLQEPLRRTALGFDYMDSILDIVVEPDLSSWVWKDQGEFQRAQEMGIYSPAEAEAIMAEAQRVIERINAKAPPFSSGWQEWLTPADWTMPELPPGWEIV